MIANPTYPQCLRWIIVLAALTCVSTSSSTVELKTIFAGSATPKHPLGVVGESDARVKHGLRTTSDTTNSMNVKNEERGLDGVSNIAESIEAGLRESAVIPEVPTPIVQGLPARSTESAETGVISGGAAIDHASAGKVNQVVEKTNEIMIQNRISDLFEEIMGDQYRSYGWTGNLFKSVKYKEWSNFVDRVSETHREGVVWAVSTKASTLLTKYGKDGVILMLAKGKADETTHDIATQMELGVLKKWCKDGNEDDIMTLLTNGRNNREILTSKSAKGWFEYLRMKKRNAYEVFVNQFASRFGDKKLVELLVVAEANDQTRTLATELAKQNEKTRGMDLFHSFNLLELNKEPLDTLLTKPKLSTWISYAKMLTPDPYEVLLLEMRKSVGDKKLDLILAATNADGTNESIRRILLQIQKNHYDLQHIKRDFPQVEGWQKEGKSGYNVFDLLELRDKGADMFETDEWSSWVAYLTFLENQKEPSDRRDIATIILPVLKSRFESEDLAKLIAAAKNAETTKELAAHLERMEWWIAGQSADEIFTYLKLNARGDAVFASPEFKTWAIYVDQLNSFGNNRNSFDELASQIYRHYGPKVGMMLDQAELTAIANKDEEAKMFAIEMRKYFESTLTPEEKELMKKIQDMSLKEKTLKGKSHMMEIDETSLEKKLLGKRLRTSSSTLADDVSERKNRKWKTDPKKN